MKNFDDCFLKVFEEINMLKVGGKLYRVPHNSLNGFNFDYSSYSFD